MTGASWTRGQGSESTRRSSSSRPKAATTTAPPTVAARIRSSSAAGSAAGAGRARRAATVGGAVVVAAFGLLVVVLLVLSLPWPLVQDAPVMHYIAWRIGEGDVPYRDLYDINQPGVYVLHLALLRTLGAGDGA